MSTLKDYEKFADDSGVSSEDENLLEGSPRKSPSQSTTQWCIVSSVILITNLAFFYLLWHKIESMTEKPYRLVYTPAESTIAYESRRFDHENIYFRNGSVNPAREHKMFGPPSEESDAAWAELIRNQNIHLSREELGEYKDMRNLVEFTDGSGYYATLSVYHSLHCVKRLHHQLYSDHYYPAKTDIEKMLMLHHTEHCLNMLLQIVMCNADLSVLPMQWAATTRIPIGLDEGHHQCMNWHNINNWMKERSVNVYQKGLVVHPLLGEAYPNGQGDDTGGVIDHLLADDGDHK